MRTGFGHWLMPTGRRRCQLQIQYGGRIVAMRISQIGFPFPVRNQGFSGASAKDPPLDSFHFQFVEQVRKSVTSTLSQRSAGRALGPSWYER